MNKRESAFISFYDKETGQVKFCVVLRERVQAAIDRALTLTLPPDAPDHSQAPFTDEDARKLGAMALLAHGNAHPELRERLEITTEAPMDWTPVEPPSE
ncbi:hypothetical protein [Paraburkholderia antibiotica]|uniref:Uncharacterized protein n=1 Tax=Paraburkholderia antibiotica TaxID=2728839 RepID=A0A7X9ZZT0_9BURK|nr:hypothetical protein [Paraburkholderia antibiotica]NML33413.1 hypothetical protein [Paraburkholderia antibiotica]